MKIIKKFDSYSSHVELVEIDDTQYILKKADKEEITNEKKFLEEFRKHSLPTLQVFERADLQDDQILLEYVPGSEKIDYTSLDEVKLWGQATRKMHDIKFEKAFRIDQEGTVEYLEWDKFLLLMLDLYTTRLKNPNNDLTDAEIEKIKQYIGTRLDFTIESYSLLHADLHYGNTLKRGDEIIIYDKGSEIFAGHHLYDLTIVTTMYGNRLYFDTDDEVRQEDAKFLSAFIEGYGENFIEKYKSQMDVYMLLRTLIRYPNPFVKYDKDIILNIIKD